MSLKRSHSEIWENTTKIQKHQNSSHPLLVLSVLAFTLIIVSRSWLLWKKHENLVLLRLHSVVAEICINKNVLERISYVSRPNGQKNLELLISPAVLGLNQLRTSQCTSQFAILSFIVLY